MKRRVVITGLGMLSSAGTTPELAREKLISGTCCLTPIQDPRASRLRARFAGQLGPLDSGFHQATELRICDRYVHMALTAARQALDTANARPTDLGRRMGLIFGTCSGPMLLIEAHYERILRGHPHLTREELFAKRYYSGAHALARALGVTGVCTTIVTACSASTSALALATDLIRCGLLDAALAGGADAFAVSTLAGFDSLKATTDTRCAPFSKPFGLNLGEAAAMTFLETAESAERRHARIHAEILGSGMSNDAYHCSAPEPAGRGLAESMERALQDAGLSPEHIGYINAHGTGTEANDRAECKAIRKVFGPRAQTLPVSSTKSIVGHCLGAAGAVETIASILCAEAGVLPPTANFTQPRDGCAVDCVPDPGRAWKGSRVFLCNNSAFGGHNASLVLSVPNSSERLPSIDSPATQIPTHDSRGSHDERIVLTAIGIVSAAGIGSKALSRHALDNPPLRTLSLPEVPPLRAGMVDETAVETFDRRLDLRSMDRSSKWATLAARLAIREAKFPEKPATLSRLGLHLNLSAGPSWAESTFLSSFLANDHQVTELAAFPYIVPSSVTGNVCRALRLSGYNLTLNPGPASALFALEPALAALRCGHVEALLCGAVDELSDRILTDHVMAGLLSTDDPAPPGEGAAVLMLETERHARARGATFLAELSGIVTRTTMSPPSAHSLEELFQETLEMAGVTHDEIDVASFTGPRAILKQWHPPWHRHVISAAPITGLLEGAQPLIDLAAALQSPQLRQDACLALIALPPTGLAGCAIFKRIRSNAESLEAPEVAAHVPITHTAAPPWG